jgi:hypothetical protein
VSASPLKPPIVVTPSPMLAAMIPAYLAKRREDVKTLRLHVDGAAFEPIRIMGHGLKGSGGSFGFMDITRIGGTLEEAAQRQDRDAILAATAELEEFLGRVQVAKA